jgi:hypothetical protein
LFFAGQLEHWAINMMRTHCTLSCFRRPVTGPLHLLDRNENGLTFALGYALRQSYGLRRKLLEAIGISRKAISDRWSLSLQARSEEGITDLELHAPQVHVVIEAKKAGWPLRSQLLRYAQKLKKESGVCILCPLATPPVCLSTVQDWHPGRGLSLRHLRWVQILEMVLQVQKEDDSPFLGELGNLIQETIGMQAYNREVLVRDLKCNSPSYDLFFAGGLYTCQPNEKTEPLFFAPCFSGPVRDVHKGIHYFSRVYYKTTVALQDREASKQALEKANVVIQTKIQALSKRKTTADEIKYLMSLPIIWERGLRSVRHKRGEHAIFFLGEPIPMPRPVHKVGKMIPLGFSMSLEKLMKGNEAFFKC